MRSHSADSPGRATVLLVDREALYRWFVAESLRAAGIAVVSCGSMDEAASALRGGLPVDLLIVDGGLLEEGDAEALHAMSVRAGATPCLVLDPDGDMSPSRFGGLIVVAKPVDSAAVISLVTRQLYRHPAA